MVEAISSGRARQSFNGSTVQHLDLFPCFPRQSVRRTDALDGRRGGRSDGRENETPNPKHQAPNTRKAPMLKLKAADVAGAIGIWTLGLLWCLELGVWCFHPVAFEIRISLVIGHWSLVIGHSHRSASIGLMRAARRAGK
jgi:hypothetical protein